MKIVNKEEFETLIGSEHLVLVDFFANWCGPCKMAAPVLEEIAKENTQLTIVKVDVDQESALASSYGIQSIPNMILFKDGKPIDQIVGFANKETLMKQLAPNIQ